MTSPPSPHAAPDDRTDAVPDDEVEHAQPVQAVAPTTSPLAERVIRSLDFDRFQIADLARTRNGITSSAVSAGLVPTWAGLRNDLAQDLAQVVAAPLVRAQQAWALPAAASVAGVAGVSSLASTVTALPAWATIQEDLAQVVAAPLVQAQQAWALPAAAGVAGVSSLASTVTALPAWATIQEDLAQAVAAPLVQVGEDLTRLDVARVDELIHHQVGHALGAVDAAAASWAHPGVGIASAAALFDGVSSWPAAIDLGVMSQLQVSLLPDVATVLKTWEQLWARGVRIYADVADARRAALRGDEGGVRRFAHRWLELPKNRLHHEPGEPSALAMALLTIDLDQFTPQQGLALLVVLDDEATDAHREWRPLVEGRVRGRSIGSLEGIAEQARVARETLCPPASGAEDQALDRLGGFEDPRTVALAGGLPPADLKIFQARAHTSNWREAALLVGMPLSEGDRVRDKIMRRAPIVQKASTVESGHRGSR